MARNIQDYFTTSTAKEFLSFFCGDLIGEGAARAVYECDINPLWVVKFEHSCGNFQNVFEWDTWNWLKDRSEAKWLAPCLHISSCGTWLIQAKTDPLPSGYKLPRQLPMFLGDRKRDNFGLLGGKFVAHDYGTTNRMVQSVGEKAGRAFKLEKSGWF